MSCFLIDLPLWHYDISMLFMGGTTVLYSFGFVHCLGVFGCG